MSSRISGSCVPKRKTGSSPTGTRVLVALGGNAILKHRDTGTAEEQLHNILDICRILAGMVAAGYHIAITHGNGPQVGDILLKNELAKETLPPMPLDVCGAESQGMIGYMLQQSLHNELCRAGINRRVATLLTQTLVDERDPSFQKPEKPIGPFYPEGEAKRLRKEKGWTLINDAGRGFRRVVPSPEPREIIEGGMIRTLFDEGFLVFAAGGGGIPVVKHGREGTLRGIEAVIDKDHTAALLAHDLAADVLLILTDVDNAFLNFGRVDAVALGRIPAETARRHLAAGHFPKGSMGPKVESALRFIADGGKKAIITSPSLAMESLSGTSGTIITRDGR
jgi:carbamate kinase